MRDFDLSTPLIRVEPPLDTTSLSPLSVQFPFSVQLLFFSSNQPPVLGVDVWTNLARGNEWAASPLTDVTAETLQRSKIVGLPAGVIVRSFEGRITPYKTGFHEFTIRVTFDNGRGSDCWWSSSFGKNGKIFVTDVTESSPPASRVRGIGDILLGIDHSWFIPETKWVGSPGYKSPRPSSPLTPILTSPSPTASSSTVSPVSSPSSTSSSSSPSTIHSGQPIAPFRLSRTPSPSPGFPSASLGQSALSLGDLHNENVVLSGVLRFPVESAYWARLIPVGLVNHFGLIRKNAWWLEPNLYRGSDKPTQFFLFERSDHLFVVLIPLTVNGVASAILPQRDSTIGVQVTLEEGHDGRARIYVMVATGKSPAQIVSFAMERVRCYMMINAGMDWSSAMRLAKVKSPLSLGVDAAKNPQWYDRLGVCTWNMFYKQPTHEGCLSAIASLIHDYQIPVGYLLLDDGYAQTTQLERLTSFEPDPRKFPRGLSTFVEDVRRRFGVKHFGVWHALQGYWNGVENDSILGRQYALRNIKSRPNVWVVEGSDVERFYENLYTYLKQQGIDFFKIDNQASFDLYLNEPLYNKQPLWRLYQDAILRVAYPSCIWCMGQSPNITYYTFSYAIPTLHGTNTTPGTSTPPNPPTPPPQQVQPFPVSRSSDDYYPEKIDLQAGHVLTNGMNNIWTSAWGNFLADWDMFQSDIAFGAYQAAARSLNNGPIYISDEPGGTDPTVVRPLFIGSVPPPTTTPRHSNPPTPNPLNPPTDGLGDHRVLRPVFPALPSNDCVFCDARDVQRALKLCNGNFVQSTVPYDDANVYVAGFFNARTEVVVDQISCRTVMDTVGWRFDTTRDERDNGKTGTRTQSGRYAAFSFNHRQVRAVDQDEPVVVFLRPADFEIVGFSPIIELSSDSVGGETTLSAEVSCLGLIDKYNGSVAIRSVEATPHAEGTSLKMYKVTLWGRGVTGFFVRRTDKRGADPLTPGSRLEDNARTWLKVTLDGVVVSQERLGSEDEVTLLVDARIEGREAVSDATITLELIPDGNGSR